MAHAALERMVDFIGSNATPRAPERLMVKFQNVFARSAKGTEAVFKNAQPKAYIDIDVKKYSHGGTVWAEFDLKEHHYRSNYNVSQIRNDDTWEVKDFIKGRYIEFYRGDDVLRFTA
jgi:hypothetical protein